MGHFSSLQQDLHAERHCWLSRFGKHESAEYRMLGSSVGISSVSIVSVSVAYREQVRKILRKNEYRKRNQLISDGLPRTSKTDDSY